LGKVLAWKGLGLLCFIPEIPKLGGLKVPSTFGIKDLLLIHELNLCLSITTRTYTYCGFVLSSEVRQVPGMLPYLFLLVSDLSLLQNCFIK
jgi:hypothetical protein